MVRATYIGVVLALALHLAFGILLAGMRSSWPRPAVRRPLFLELEPPREVLRPMYLVASMPVPASALEPVMQEKPRPGPTGPPENPPPPASPEPTPPINDVQRQELQAERQRLVAQLQQQKTESLNEIDEQLQVASRIKESPQLKIAAGSLGTVRELDLKGWPQGVIDQVMARYDLRITERYAPGDSNQSFLSSAATAAGGRYYASRGGRAGRYQVFELSREAVAHMSRLEEAEIRRRNLDLERTRVASVTFGIVQTAAGQYDIGILSFQAEQVP